MIDACRSSKAAQIVAVASASTLKNLAQNPPETAPIKPETAPAKCRAGSVRWPSPGAEAMGLKADDEGVGLNLLHLFSTYPLPLFARWGYSRP